MTITIAEMLVLERAFKTALALALEHGDTDDFRKIHDGQAWLDRQGVVADTLQSEIEMHAQGAWRAYQDAVKVDRVA